MAGGTPKVLQKVVANWQSQHPEGKSTSTNTDTHALHSYKGTHACTGTHTNIDAHTHTVT